MQGEKNMAKKLNIVLLSALILLIIILIFIICIDGDLHIHKFDDWTITKNATCTEAGEKERYCSCGDKQLVSITATGHTFNE